MKKGKKATSEKYLKYSLGMKNEWVKAMDCSLERVLQNT